MEVDRTSHSYLLGVAEAEIERLQDAKRRALALADERSKENVDLRAEIERLSARLVESDRIADGYYREMRRGSDLVEQKMAEIERLRAGVHRYLSGDWMQRPPSKMDKCPHGRFGYEDCGACTDEYFVELLGPEPSKDDD